MVAGAALRCCSSCAIAPEPRATRANPVARKVRRSIGKPPEQNGVDMTIGNGPASRGRRKTLPPIRHSRPREREVTPSRPPPSAAPQGRGVKAPGFGNRRKAMLKDIAVLTDVHVEHKLVEQARLIISSAGR